MKPARFIPLIVLVVLAGVLLHALQDVKPEKTSRLMDQKAPQFGFTILSEREKTFAPQDWRGRAYVVNFFASWCMPCRIEHPLLTELAREGVPVVGIAYKDRTEATKKMLSDLGDPFALVASDLSGRGGIEWGLTGVPETFVIDRDGVVRFHHLGPLKPAMIRDEILPLYARLKE